MRNMKGVLIATDLMFLLLYIRSCYCSCMEVKIKDNNYCTEGSICKIPPQNLSPIIDSQKEEATQPLSREGFAGKLQSAEEFSNIGVKFESNFQDNEVLHATKNRRMAEFLTTNKSDAEILLQFKKEIVDPSNALKNWEVGRNVCLWAGVVCRSNSQSVIALNLTSRSLKGAILPELGELKMLFVLDLSFNEFSGEIPASLGSCFSLKILLLQANHLAGTLPPQLGFLSNLVVLNLESNMLNGSDSLKILANCSSLHELSLGHNRFSGFIPRAISKLNSLTVLRIHFNQFRGVLPSQIGHLTELQSLLLDNNLLNGSIPRSIGYLQNLKTFDMGNNHLSGSITFTIFRCSSLTELRLGTNMLDGLISSSIGQLQHLTVLQLNSNLLTGSIPSTLGNCLKLQDVNLSGNKLDGNIPATISKVGNLTSLDLSLNNLSGEIPPALANLSKISFLNFSENNLEGQIPDMGVFLRLTPASFLGNPLLCGRILQRPNCHLSGAPLPAKLLPKHRKHHVFVWIAVAFASGFSAVIFASTWWCIRRFNSKNKTNQLAEAMDFFQRMSKATAEVARDATQNYEAGNVVGIGHSSSVYRGILSDGTIVAVKLLQSNKCVDESTFFRECHRLIKIRHRNIVSIYSVISHMETKALVLPFLFGGTLHKRLHDPDRQRPLSWESRLKIAIDVAEALHYLHFARSEAVIHGGLRPTNILLDDDMIAHVSDFGMFSLLKPTAITGSSTSMHASIEYEAPEYAHYQKHTAAGDVYSYGVVLLEMITGRNPTSDVYSGGNLRRWVKIALHEKATMQVLDKVLLESNNLSLDMPVMSGLLKLAVHCTEVASDNRPTSKDVLALLMQIETYQEIRVKSFSRAVFPVFSPYLPQSLKTKRFISHSL